MLKLFNVSIWCMFFFANNFLGLQRTGTSPNGTTLPFGICTSKSILYSSDSITAMLTRYKTSISYHICCIMPLPRIRRSIIVTWILSLWWILISCRVMVVLVSSRKIGLVIWILASVYEGGALFFKKCEHGKEIVIKDGALSAFLPPMCRRNA